MAGTWPALGRHLAGTWPALGRHLAGTWPALGRHLAGSLRPSVMVHGSQVGDRIRPGADVGN